MEIKIYQINRDRDKNFVKFLHYKHLDNFQETKDINASIYDEVFRGDADCEDLEDVYRMFNTEGHPLHRGHSFRILSLQKTALTTATAWAFLRWTSTRQKPKSRITL